MQRLENGDSFPSLTAQTADGDTIDLPDDQGDDWALVAFYRGHW